MSAAAAARVGRFYTAARRHPWVLGKVADWKIPLGPYTPAQIAVAVGGGFLLIKTIGWWSWMGPIPIVAWVLVIWMVRRPKIRGRAPMQAALGWVLLGWQPRGGRIGGRAARDRAPHPLLGGFTIEDTPTPGPAAQPAPSPAIARRLARAPHPDPAAQRASASRPTQTHAVPTGPVSGVQQLLALAQQGGAR
ncbi:hypothetical protein PV332_15265 [Streptomyces scabiei]|uniref:hypothetical protein n=1 Tax=Streptomyces scabiei TaxID=1930 RepID=UPI0029B5080D|nr:hypothetical protein [Streptomyces scabiei]MDX2576829.1 hypothetical protein [Streptomyces scabiei]MDX3030212.1 hypothetical protein [Streptomyces scabiei]MDX3208785.1 hypothetical protein [Streptomyces scabiei]